MKKTILTLFAALLLALPLGLSVAADDGESHVDGAESASLETREYSGEVLKVESDKLTIDTSEGSKEFNVPSGIRIERNASDVTIDKIKPGDKVTIKAAGNEAVAVSVTAGSTIEKLIKFAVISALLLLLFLVLRRVIKKRNQGFIKTTPTNLKEGE